MPEASFQRLLEQCVQRLHAQGATQAVAWLRTRLARQAASARLADGLQRCARVVLRYHPAQVLALAQAADQVGAGSADLKLAQMLAHDALGQAVAVRKLAVALMDTPGVSPEGRLIVANLLCRIESSDRALAVAQSAFAELGKPLKHVSSVLYIAQRHADWALVEQLTRQLRDAYAQGDFSSAEEPRVNMLWCDDLAINLALLRSWNARNLWRHVHEPPRFAFTPARGRQLRIGYLSSDWREHPTNRLMLGLLRQHDRRRVHVTLYDSGWDDGSTLRADALSHADQWRSVASLSDAAAAERIRADEIDVLVELNGPTRAHRMGILQHRAAPVQVNYLGWPGSVGGGPVDYLIGDAVTIPPGQEALYPEAVIRLDPVYQVNDYAAQPRLPMADRRHYGLPPEALVLGMFNAIDKVHGEVWQAWMTILKQVPQAVIWMLDPGAVACRRISDYTHACGVDPGRILIAPRVPQQAHLQRLSCCDLMLDPWPCGGHTTTADALFAGVPVIALEGGSFASRVSSALLRAAGLRALVHTEVSAYVNMAVKLLQHPRELARIQHWLRHKVPQLELFNTASKARQLEGAYVHIYERAHQGLPPEHVNLKIQPKTS